MDFFSLVLSPFYPTILFQNFCWGRLVTIKHFLEIPSMHFLSTFWTKFPINLAFGRKNWVFLENRRPPAIILGIDIEDTKHCAYPIERADIECVLWLVPIKCPKQRAWVRGWSQSPLARNFVRLLKGSVHQEKILQYS